MAQDLLILNFASMIAAALQSATGIGFGVIAGPILLLLADSGDALQICIILNILIAAILAPALRHNVDRKLLLKFSLGAVVGLPIGVYVVLNIEFAALKVLAGLAILSALAFTVFSNESASEDLCACGDKNTSILVGLVSGVMGGSLAMPGPIPAAWMTAAGCNKESIRASIHALFVITYSGALLFLLPTMSVGSDSVRTSVLLVPATLMGIYVGHVLSNRLNEALVRRVISVFLILSAALLFLSVF